MTLQACLFGRAWRVPSTKLAVPSPCLSCHSLFQPDDPIEIIKRLVVGSEGTLAFVSQATYNTVPEWPHKESLKGSQQA